MFWYNAGEENKTIEKKIEKKQTETDTLITGVEMKDITNGLEILELPTKKDTQQVVTNEEMDDMADADEYEFVGDYINDFITDDEKEEEKEEAKEQGIVVQKVIKRIQRRAKSKGRGSKIASSYPSNNRKKNGTTTVQQMLPTKGDQIGIDQKVLNNSH